MRFATLLAASVATAAICAGSSAVAGTAQLASLSKDAAVSQSAAADSFSAQSEDAADGALYGVRGRPAGSTLGGSGSFEVMHPSSRSASVTPGACSSGWCDTPAHIAASVFSWDGHAGGAGVIIGIVDTGIDLNHPDFAGRILTGTCIVSSVNPCINSWDQVGGDTAVFPGPNATHGTHVAGIAAGSQTGIAPLADILPVKVCSSTASSCAGVDAGIVWAASHGANVINVSIGGPILTAGDIASFRTAVADGALLVVAAGNSGNKDPSSGFLAGAALQDGVRGSMIVVGATTAGGSGGKGTIASFSQVPSTQCEVHGGKRYCLDDYFVVAPGVNIWSTVGNGTATGANYGYLSGTSMATPYVTGVAAVIKGNWPSLTSSQVASIIFQTADDLGAPGPDPIYGRGAVDITKALGPVGTSIVASGTFSAGSNTPTNVAAIVSAVGGGQASASTLSHYGTLGAMSSLVSGPLAVAVRNSTILKSAVVIDSFGRTFKANLTNSTYVQPIANLDQFLAASFFQSFSGFGAAVDTPLGLVSVSGYSVTTNTAHTLFNAKTPGDTVLHDLRDFSMNVNFTSNMSMQFGYNTQMSGMFNAYDAVSSRAFDGEFFSASALNSPYVSLTDGGNYIGTTLKLSDTVRLAFGASSLVPQSPEFEVPDYPMVNQLLGTQPKLDQRRADASMAAVTWDFAKWGGIGVTLSQVDEYDGLLGGFNSGALAISRLAQTTAAGLSSRVGFGDGWVATAAYSEGISRLSLRPNGLVDSADTLHSRSYGVALSKYGVFRDQDSLGIALTRPIAIYQGGVDLTAATGVDTSGDLIVSHEHVSLASATPETDLEAGYTASYFDGRMSLQANAAYQMNVNGRNGADGVTVLSRVSFNF